MHHFDDWSHWTDKLVELLVRSALLYARQANQECVVLLAELSHVVVVIEEPRHLDLSLLRANSIDVLHELIRWVFYGSLEKL